MGKNNLVNNINSRNDSKIKKGESIIPKEIDNVIESKIDISKIVPAPEDWNIFEPIDDDTMAEMMFSISENGLIHPIVVWESEEDKYMVLSGHNRLECYKKLYNKYNDSKYLFIEAKIIPKESINEKIAKEIVIDSNYIQRKYTNKTLHKLLTVKANMMTDRKNKINEIAKDTDISLRKLYEEFQIIENLIDPLKSLYYDETITRRNAIKLTTMFNNNIQKFLFKNHQINDKIVDVLYKNFKVMAKNNNITLNQLKDIISENDIDDLLEENTKIKKVSIKIPEIYQSEIMELIQEFLAKKGAEQ